MTSTDPDAFDNTINDASFLQRIVELNLTDPRAQDRIIYPLSVICSIVILARICNCNDAREQRLFWLEKQPWLKENFYGLSDDVPSEQTLRRVVSILNTDETVNFLTNYFANHRELSEKTLGSVPLKEREVIAADGQNINATRSSKNGNDARKDSGIDIVSLHSSTYGITLSQRTVDKKNHEAEVILDMIKALNLRNAILTWDAINTRPYTVKAVVDANADFLVCLKDNQGNLIDDVKTGFQFYDMDKYPGESVSSTMVFEAHGRKEGKEIAILDAKYALSKEMRKKWPDVNSVIRVRTTRIYKNSNTIVENEDRFYISSLVIDGLDKEFADTMLKIILQRWKVESMHWVLDVVFEQDQLPLRNRDYINNSTIYTKMAFNILSYIRDNIPYHYNKPWSFKTLRMLAQKDDYGFKFMKAFFTRDMSELENDEGLIGIVYKEAEPTGNDIPDNLKETGFEASINDDTPLGKFARGRHKIKAKRT